MYAVFDVKTTLLVSSIAGLISGYLAYRRGKSPIFWFFIGLLFGFFGVFALFFSTNKRKQSSPSPQAKRPEPYLFGPSNKFWYYLDATNTQVGPMSYNGMANAWKQGVLPPSAFVWHEDLAEWKPLQELIRTESGE
jgi:hypothetical protein